METLGKRDVAEVIANNMYCQSCTTKDVVHIETALHWLLELMEDAFSKNIRVHFVGFGALTPKFKKSRAGRNPQTLEPHLIAERITVTFVPRCYDSSKNRGKLGTCDLKKLAREVFDTAWEADSFIDEFINLLKGMVTKNRRFEFRHFGTFRPVFRKARNTRNPKTQETIVSDEKMVPHFKISKKMVERLTASQ